ncbi:MAG TPA: TetR/AcrR family transcriptional regulator, partial [Deinococcales bacterium]|nr:TetR/AcrR family transcriptional regulator [Deinococcales bacterium]
MSAHSNGTDGNRAQRRSSPDSGRRGQILQAALRVFASKGFQRSTTKDIAREAGVAEGTLYNHFPSKDAILLALLEDLIGATSAVPAAQGGDLDGLLRRQLRLSLGAFDGTAGEVLGVVLAELLTNRELRESYAGPLLAPNYALAEAALAEHGSGGQHELTARAIPALFLGLA